MIGTKFIIIIITIVVIIALALGLGLGLTLKKKNKFIQSNITWDQSYEKAKNFISKLTLTERINLLFGTQNMKMETLLIEDESELH